MNQPCPKCGSKNTYEIGRDCGCRMCGKQFPREGVTPIVLTKVFNERKKDMPEEIKKTSSGKTGPCINCGREKFIADKFGHCGTCCHAVKDLEQGTPAYTAALASVKVRLTSGNVGRAPRALRTEKPPRKKAPAERKSTLDLTIKEVALAGIPAIIQAARDEQAFYLSEAEKLGKAINIMESL